MEIKILILGASGMLGHVTYLYLKHKGHNVIGISNTRRIDNESLVLDISNEVKFNEFLDDNSFDIIINCIAVLVNKSEEDKEKAIYINSYIPHMLEKKYINSKTKIIQVSSDGVFLGDKAPYNEKSFPDAKTFYGRTKALGEIINKKDLTIRGSFIGPDISKEGEGIFNWFINQKNSVNGYSDVLLNGVTSLEFAKFVECIINKYTYGIYNLGAYETYSKYELLCLVKKVFNKEEIDIIPISTPKSNHTLSIKENEFYETRSIEYMLFELKKWMVYNKDIYKHYNLS